MAYQISQFAEIFAENVTKICRDYDSCQCVFNC